MSHLEYIISYGLSGDFGRFRAAHPFALPRGGRAVIRSGRGVEIGQVLRPATARHAAYLPNTTVGALLRPVEPEDEARAEQLLSRASEMLERGGGLIAALQLPLALLDAEVLLDGDHAALLYLHWDRCDMREMVSTLSREFAVSIALVDLTAPVVEAVEQEDHGCGDCGSGGGCGSCGSGCGSCGCAKPEQVQEQFSALREKMDQRRVALL